MRFYNQPHEYYCGIDLHVKTMYVCILDGVGQVLVHGMRLGAQGQGQAGAHSAQQSLKDRPPARARGLARRARRGRSHVVGSLVVPGIVHSGSSLAMRGA